VGRVEKAPVFLKALAQNDSEDALRPGRLVRSGMELLMQITLTEITCRYSNFITDVLLAKKFIVE
jgi:hypothetical protein